MKLTIIVAARGRPQLMLDTVRRLSAHMARDNTTLLVCVDLDDRDNLDALRQLPQDHRVSVSAKVREDCLGAKYNRALKEAPADVYYPAVDYAPCITEGFDQIILDAAAVWPDGIGTIYGPMVDEIIPCALAFTAGIVEKVGRIYSEDYPFWFVDHEACDIACMLGRVNFADIRVDISRRPPKTHRLRDLDFWMTYYDAHTMDRQKLARGIIDSTDFDAPVWLKEQLCNSFALVEARSLKRHHLIRENIAAYEDQRGAKMPPDEGYVRAFKRAHEKLCVLYSQLEAAQAAA